MSCFDKCVQVLPTDSIQVRSKVSDYLKELKNRKFYIESDRDREEWDSGDEYENGIDDLNKYVKENYPEIVEKSRHGDFIEDGAVSGYRSSGLYIIYKKKDIFEIRRLEAEPDDYGSIPDDDFVAFRDVIPGFQFDLIEEPECQSGWHNSYCPVDLEFLRKQKIENFSFTSLVKYSSFNYRGKDILVLYPFGYSLESKLKVDYFYFFMDFYEDYINMIFDSDKWDEDDKKNDTYSKIDEYSKKFDIVLAPFLNLNESDDKDE